MAAHWHYSDLLAIRKAGQQYPGERQKYMADYQNRVCEVCGGASIHSGPV